MRPASLQLLWVDLDGPNHYNPAGLTFDKIPQYRLVYQHSLPDSIPKIDRELLDSSPKIAGIG